MGKRIGWKVGNTYYDGRVATDWERLEKLEAKANESDNSLFALVEAAYEENEINHYMEYVKQAAEKNHPLSLFLLAKDMPDWSFKRHFMLKKAVKGGCTDADLYYGGGTFWFTWFIIIALGCAVIGASYYVMTRFVLS